MLGTFKRFYGIATPLQKIPAEIGLNAEKIIKQKKIALNAGFTEDFIKLNENMITRAFTHRSFHHGKYPHNEKMAIMGKSISALI